MNIRIQVSRPTVKALQRRLQEAYRRDDVRLVRRIRALLDHLVNGVPVAVLSEQWGFTPACFYQWRLAFILNGLDSLGDQPGGGRQAKLTPTQKKRLGALIDAGPEATHNKYFEAFEHLVHSVEKTLAAFTTRAQEVRNRFGCYCAELGLTSEAAA